MMFFRPLLIAATLATSAASAAQSAFPADGMSRSSLCFPTTGIALAMRSACHPTAEFPSRGNVFHKRIGKQTTHHGAGPLRNLFQPQTCAKRAAMTGTCRSISSLCRTTKPLACKAPTSANCLATTTCASCFTSGAATTPADRNSNRHTWAGRG